MEETFNYYVDSWNTEGYSCKRELASNIVIAKIFPMGAKKTYLFTKLLKQYLFINEVKGN